VFIAKNEKNAFIDKNEQAHNCGVCKTNGQFVLFLGSRRPWFGYDGCCGGGFGAAVAAVPRSDPAFFGDSTSSEVGLHGLLVHLLLGLLDLLVHLLLVHHLRRRSFLGFLGVDTADSRERERERERESSNTPNVSKL